MKKRIPYLNEVKAYDVPAMTEDGVIYTAEKKIEVVVDDDPSYKQFFGHAAALALGLTSAVDIKCMLWIGDNLPYNDNLITLNKYYKQKMMSETGSGRSTVEKAISTLTDRGFLVRNMDCVKCGMYYVNPTYVFYGDKSTRDNLLKFTLSVIKKMNLPDRESGIINDIKRYQDFMQTNGKALSDGVDSKKVVSNIKDQPKIQ